MNEIDRLAGFLALTPQHAGTIQRGLATRGVLSDHRRDVLRFGQAPYLFDSKIDEAMELLDEVARGIGRSG